MAVLVHLPVRAADERILVGDRLMLLTKQNDEDRIDTRLFLTRFLGHIQTVKPVLVQILIWIRSYKPVDHQTQRRSIQFRITEPI